MVFIVTETAQEITDSILIFASCIPMSTICQHYYISVGMFYKNWAFYLEYV